MADVRPWGAWVYVWAQNWWYVWGVGPGGNVAFPPFADIEEELYENAHLSPGNLTELTGEFCKTIRDESKDNAIPCALNPPSSQKGRPAA